VLKFSLGDSSVDLQTFYRLSLFHANRLSPEGSAKVLSSIARLNPATVDGTCKEVINRICEKVHDSGYEGYSGKDVAIILNALCRLSYINPDLFAAASLRLQDLSSTEYISEKHIALIFNSFARAGIVDRALFETLIPRVDAQISSMSSQSCGNICHALGKLGIDGDLAVNLIPKLCNRLVKLPDARSQELSNALHSYAKLGITNIESLEPLVILISKRLHTFNPIEVAGVATAVAKLQLSDKPLMSAVRKRVDSTISRFNAYELTAVLHAFSQLDVPLPTSLFEKVPSEIFQDTNPQTACIALCAFARAGVIPSDKLVYALENAIKEESNPQLLVDVLFGMSRFETLTPPLVSVLQAVVQVLASKSEIPITTANINQLIYGIKKLELLTSSGVPEMSNVYIKALSGGLTLIKGFDERQISNLLFAFASSKELSQEEKRFSEQLAMRITEISNPQLFASCLESLAKLDIRTPSLWNTIERRLRVVITDSPTQDVQIAQALAHIGRFKDETAGVILKRIEVSKLTVSSVTALLYTLLHAGMDTEEIVKSIARNLQSCTDRMTSDQFIDVSKLLKSCGVHVVPFKYVNDYSVDLTFTPLSKYHASKERSEDRSETVGTLVSLLLQEGRPTDNHEYILWLINEVELVQAENCTDSIKAILAAELIGHIRSAEVDIDTLCAVIRLLSPIYDEALSEIALRVLKRAENTCTLEHIKILLRIESTHVRDYILQRILPSIIQDRLETPKI
jgi:hypothetical protein